METIQITLTQKQCEIAVEALDYYLDLICMADVNGTDEDCDNIEKIINKIKLRKRKIK